ncbi:MAG TPA: GNAT family N-acetyltransferase [Blastocatellia bacterium]
MFELIEVKNEESFNDFCAASAELSHDAIASHKADAHWIAVDRGDVKARCSLWWTDAPAMAGQKVGLIGHYAASCARSARELLQEARRQLARRGCSMAFGPIDGNTWRRYRLITERGAEPRFFLEPDNADEWPAHFYQSGFISIAGYSSALNEDLSRRDPHAENARSHLREAGVVIRAMRISEFREELSRIYSVAALSFRKSFLYTPIDEESFIAQYEPVKAHIKPELCLVAEKEGRAVGFIFALPDAMQAARGQQVDTIIIKTLAVLPELGREGLGSLLADRCQKAAAEMGYRRAIHALMSDANNSRRISNRYARVIRRYALFGCPLQNNGHITNDR